MQNKHLSFLINKISKSSNMNYALAIKRNKANKPKEAPLISLLAHLNKQHISEENLDSIVRQYWIAVEKNPKFEKEIADKIKIKYNNKV